MKQSERELQRQIISLWSARWLILSVTAICTIAAGAAAFMVSKRYEGTVLLSPVSPDKGGSFGSSLTQMGVLGQLAGISLGSDSTKSEAVAYLQSESLTDAYILKNNLLPVIYSKYWDAGAGNWKSAKDASKHTLWMANKYVDRSLRKVTTSGKNGLVSLAITWRDPVEAARWANGMVELANESLRDKAIQQSERNIAYLTAEAAKTNVVEARQAIFSIMQKELTKAMIARGSEEYAFKVIDPATVSEKASYPKKTVWILGGAFVGLLLSVTFHTIRTHLNN